MPNPTLILHHVVKDKARKKPFNLDMEISAILCFAEARRKKPGIIDVSSEKISFISKMYYPIWVVPWKDSCFFVDGLEIFSYTFPYVKLPDVELLTEEIKRNIAYKDQFRDALKKHALTFEKTKLTRISLEAILAEENLLSILGDHFGQASALKERRSERVALMPPKLNEETASEKAKKAVDLWRQIQSEIKGLQYAISVLNEETSFEAEMIFREIEHIRKLYETKIAPLRLIVEKKIEKLLLKRDAKIAKLDKSIERKLAARIKEKKRLERELERLERNLIEYRKRRKISRSRGDDVSASKWEHRVKVHQNRPSETKRRLQTVSELIEKIRKQGDREVQEVKASYQLLIESERKKILDIEASQELEVGSRRREIEEMKADESIITGQIRRLIELKRSEATGIAKATIPHRIEGNMLLCLPFYLVRYETKEKTRYLVFPPVVAMDFKGIVRKLQKALHRFSLQSRIGLLLRSKSTALDKMLKRVLPEKIRRDGNLEKAVYELGVSNNILHSSGFKQMITRGTEELRNEGWISREEKEGLLKTYF